MIVLENSPYQNESLNRIYDLLFCDDLALFQPDDVQRAQYPYDVLFASEPDVKKLQEIVGDESVESRLRILAGRSLRHLGLVPADTSLLGVIVEVGLEGGLDVVAAYRDGTARYINHSEKIIFWDASTPVSARLTEAMMAAGNEVLEKIGPWHDPRPAQPENGYARISFLAGGQFYFGHGPFNSLYSDPMASPVLDAALQLMTFLTQH